MMKRKMFAVTLCFLVGTTSVLAQSDDCNKNSSISHEAVRANNFRDAYQPWKEVLKACPLLRFYTFSDGFKILKAFMEEDMKANGGKKNSAEYKKYFDELMEVHDERIKHIPDFRSRMNGVLSTHDALGIKAIDYISHAPEMDPKIAYQWLSECINNAKSEAPATAYHFFLDTSLSILRKDASHKDQFVEDYQTATQYVEEAFEKEEKEATKNTLQTVKDNLIALFINSGAADCESLQEIYAPKVEEHKNDLPYLKQVIDIMRMMRCTDQETYFQASFYSYQIEPTAGAATGCAYMSYKKGDIDAAIKFFDEAIDLEKDEAKKAELTYATATVMASIKKISQARSYALKALSYNANYGAPYILIANLYAGNPNWSDESTLNKCTYFLVLDKLQRAKAVDPSVTEEANKLISSYSAYTPAANDLFMLGYKTGDKVNIGGWIGETTTIR